MRPNPNTALRTTGAYFGWEVPHEGVSVLLHLSVVELLDRDAIRAGDASAAGVLLGRVERGRQLKLIVESYEPATPERGSSESPFKDRRLVSWITNRWLENNRRISAVGFYRTCGREGAILNKDDLSALDASVNVANAICTDNLRNEQSNDGAARSIPTGRPSIAAGVIVEPETRWTGLPDTGPVRIFVLIEPRVRRGGQACLYLARGGAILCQSPWITFNRTELSHKRLLRQLTESTTREFPTGTEEALVWPQESKFRMSSADVTGSLLNWRWLLLSILLIAILSVGFFRFGGAQMLGSWPANRGRVDGSQLGLKLERKGSDLELTWNQDAPIMLQAKKAHLRISDDFISKNIDLDPSELRNGRILYTPTSDDVVVRLEVEAVEPKNPVSESVRIIASLLPAMPISEAHSSEASLGVRTASRPLGGFSSTTPYRDWSNKPGPTETPSDSVRVPKKVVLTSKLPPLGVSPGASVNARLPSDSTTYSAAVAEPIPLSTRVLPAELILRRDPVYPPKAKRKNIAGAIEVHFTIDANGKVRDATAVHGDPELAQAAVEAVRGWRFRPARVDDVPAEVTATTVVVFKLN